VYNPVCPSPQKSPTKQAFTEQKCSFSFGEETLVAPLIATPNLDNANRRQKKGKKLNYMLHVILMQKGIVFVFAN
jgi:hypothetical protein